MIASNTIYLNVDKASVDGKKELNKEPMPSLTDKQAKLFQEARIDKDEYIAMEQFSRLLPRGHRKLKLNMPELRNEIFSNPKLATLTDEEGLKAGGLVSYKMKGNAVKGTALIKELSQKDYGLSIKNNNRVESFVNLNNGKNPSYSSFRNKFMLK